VSPRLLIRMRSQVQVLAGPPAIVAGQSAVGSKPGTLAASLGRAGAARPPPPATGARHAAWPALEGQRQARPPPAPDPGPRVHHRQPRRPWVTSAASPGSGPARPSTRAARRRGPCRIGLPQPPPPDGDQTDASGRTGRTPAGWPPDGPDTGRPDAGSRTTNQVTGHRTGRTPDGWTPHAGRGPATDAMAGVLAVSRTATVSARWRPVGHSAGQTRLGEQPTRTAQQQGLRGHHLPTDGLDHRHDRQLLGHFAGQAAPRRTAVLGKRLESRVARDGDCHPLWRVRLSVDVGRLSGGAPGRGMGCGVG
jgi:hypothetical protein